MSQIVRQQLIIAGVLTAIVVGFKFTPDAKACEPECRWKTVTTYVPVEQTRVEYVTRYNHCGAPYRAKVLVSETIQVPVSRRVKMCN